MAFSCLNKRASLWLVVMLAVGCQQGNLELKRELQKTLNTLTKAVEEVDGEGLIQSVYFPELEQDQYREHVKQLLVDYLLALKNGRFGFDSQGILLIRFLGIGHHRYKVVSVSENPGQPTTANMRIGIRFAYDANIRFSDLEAGTILYIPKKPWPEFYEIRIGGENEAPREQLAYLEIDISFVDHGAGWRVAKSSVVDASIEYEISLESH